ncbi:MAG TPA: redoxin domain-containing protein [Candidatus Eisenbacteria bacterium]|jgi:thiol-disulfide isomerase/thioredoxin
MTRIPALHPDPTATLGRTLVLAATLSLPLVLAWRYPAHAGPAPGTGAPAASASGLPAPADADSPAELLDRPARAWSFDRWVGTPPLTLDSLRGRVVLVRWFTTGCRYCAHTLPALEALRTRYAGQGLVVVGVFHPKPVRPVRDAFVLRTAEKLGFRGPLAVDERWSTLDRWWLANHPERNWTSVSFLIDREGIVRWAHGGGEYHPSSDPRHASCDASYAGLERTIRRLLDERAAAR